MDIIESLEDVKKLYNISSNKKTTKTKSRKADYGFEVFLDTTYDNYSISNSFKTSFERLATWIFVLNKKVKVEIGSQEDFDVLRKNKVNKDKFAEIEIKVKKRNEAEDGVMKHGLTIHVFLTTSLIQVKGPLFAFFQSEVFPLMFQEVSTMIEGKNVNTTMEMPVTSDDKRERVIDSLDQPVCATTELVDEYHDRCIADNAPEVSTAVPIAPGNLLSNKKQDVSEFSEILEVIKKVDLLSFVNSVQKDQARIANHLSSIEEKQSKFESHIKKAVDDQLIIMDNKLTEHLNKISVKDQSDQDKESLFRQIKSFEAQIDLLNKEVDDKNTTISKLSKANSSLHLKIQEKDNFMANLQMKLENYAMMNKDLNEKISQTKSSITDFEDVKSRNCQLIIENSSLKCKIDQLSNEIISLKENLNFNRDLIKIKDTQTIITHGVSKDQKKDEFQDCLIIGDSMLKHVNYDWLLNKEGISIHTAQAYTVEELIQVLSEEKKHYKCIFFHT